MTVTLTGLHYWMNFDLKVITNLLSKSLSETLCCSYWHWVPLTCMSVLAPGHCYWYVTGPARSWSSFVLVSHCSPTFTFFISIYHDYGWSLAGLLWSKKWNKPKYGRDSAICYLLLPPLAVWHCPFCHNLALLSFSSASCGQFARSCELLMFVVCPFGAAACLALPSTFAIS